MAWGRTGVLYTLHGGILKSLHLMQGAAYGENMSKMPNPSHARFEQLHPDQRFPHRVSKGNTGCNRGTLRSDHACRRIKQARQPHRTFCLLHNGVIFAAIETSEFL